jgi:hypothetical protein
MCPEPLRFNGGGVGTDGGGTGNPNDAGTPQEMNAPTEVEDFGGVKGTEAKDREKANEKSETQSNPNEDRAREKEKDMTELDRAYQASKKDLVDMGLYGLGKLGERMGVEVTEARAREREAAEAEASQPGDTDDDNINKLVDGEIKEKEIKTTGLEDLLNNNIYIEGVGYVPRSQAGLMSQTTV